MEKSCPFCVPEPSRLLVAEGLVVALRDGYPVSRGHSLIPIGSRPGFSGRLAQPGADHDFVERRAQAAALVFLQEPQLD